MSISRQTVEKFYYIDQQIKMVSSWYRKGLTSRYFALSALIFIYRAARRRERIREYSIFKFRHFAFQSQRYGKTREIRHTSEQRSRYRRWQRQREDGHAGESVGDTGSGPCHFVSIFKVTICFSPFVKILQRVMFCLRSDFGALLHIVKGCLGAGILAMPFAFKNAGIVLGTIGAIVTGIIVTHTTAMLVMPLPLFCTRVFKTQTSATTRCKSDYHEYSLRTSPRWRQGGRVLSTLNSPAQTSISRNNSIPPVAEMVVR